MSAYLIAARRSAVCAKDGAFAALEPHMMAAPVIACALQDAGLSPEQVDELILSNALGTGGNPARVAALAAGLPERVAGLSIDRQCAGGMDAIVLARQMILSGDADVVVAGGVESYSRRPIRLRTFADKRRPETYDQASFTPWPDRDPDMTQAAAALGTTMGIDRTEQDIWAVESHRKARSAKTPLAEIAAIEGTLTDGFTRVLSPALCARAKPLHGDVTVANTAVAADGAAFVVVVSERVAVNSGLKAVLINGGATVGADPMLPGLAPVAAITEAFRRTGTRLSDITVAEVMEAYAVQAIACVQAAGLDRACVNIGGGALARGHPIGASGAINAVRLFHELHKRPGTGVAAIAAAGGIGTALILSA